MIRNESISSETVTLPLNLSVELKKNAVTDTFTDRRSAGSVIGTSSSSGAIRKGVDREGAIAIDNCALRIITPVKPGWGREGIAYGPFTRTNGLTFAVLLLNGHNTSQAGEIGGSLIRRLLGWAAGSQQESMLLRLWRCLWSEKKESVATILALDAE